MLDERVFNQNEIMEELPQEEIDFWFNYSQKKFLHNIDTFYYSIKFHNDFRSSSEALEVILIRRFFRPRLEQIQTEYGSFLPLEFPGVDMPLNLRPFSFAGYYNICLEYPDYFDLFIALSVPGSSDGNESVTCEWVVQLRSYMLWMYGVHKAFEKSYAMVKAVADYFNLSIDFVQENRVDYCWHSNYLANPEKFFAPDKFYKMRVDRFKDAVFHTQKVGETGHEIDYISMGKRSDKIFIRIYLKSKEVVEKGYKPWFFKVWFFQGLINRYDLYVYEEAFLKHSWAYLDYARLQFYLEHGKEPVYLEECRKLLSEEKKTSRDLVKALADRLTPRVNLIMNVEYQTMRKHTKSYGLLPVKDNSKKGECKRIYDYLDNRKIIIDYLTRDVFRLVKPDGEERKSRRDMCGFWVALRRTRLVDTLVTPDHLKLVRQYSHNLNSQLLKERSIKAAVTLGLYQKGINDDSPIIDFTEALCILNDNDIEDAVRFKNKKISQLNAGELANIEKLESTARFLIVDKDTGELLSIPDSIQQGS